MSIKQDAGEILRRFGNALDPQGRPTFHIQEVIGGATGVRVSTVLLPFPHSGGQYETCLFLKHPTGVGDSDVVEGSGGA